MITVRCANPTCEKSFTATEQKFSSHRIADFAPAGWHAVFDTQTLDADGYACSYGCAMAHATRLHSAVPSAASNGATRLH